MKRGTVWLLLLSIALALSLLLFGLFLVGKWQDQITRYQTEALQMAATGLAQALTDDERLGALAGNNAAQPVYTSVEIVKEIVLDGRLDDWPAHQRLVLGMDHLLEIRAPYQLDTLNYQLSVGNDREFVYLHYAVTDDFVVYRELGALSVHRNDHIRLGFLNASGLLERITISVFQPGELIAHEISARGRALRERPEITGRWMATESGYNLEVRIPRNLLSQQFSTVVADVDDDSDREVRFLVGLAHVRDVSDLGRLVYSPTALEEMLSSLPYAVSLTLDGRTITRTLFPASETTISATAALGGRDGHLTLEQMPDQGLALVSVLRRDLFALLLVVLLLLVMAGGVAAWFIRQAVHLAETESQTAARLKEQNDYLERMASRLNHELRTPVSIVKSSLENLEPDTPTPAEVSLYVDRAKQGVERLTGILNKMAEARRLEEALDEEEVSRFSLVSVVKGCVAGYQLAYPQHSFILTIDAEDLPVTGIPELVAQMLDKLVDNAVEFSEDGEVLIRLHDDGAEAVLRVLNRGPGLPDNSLHLVESMVSVRSAGTDDHLGLGLYIASVIARFHGGSLNIAERQDASGVTVTVRLPRLRITSRLR